MDLTRTALAIWSFPNNSNLSLRGRPMTSKGKALLALGIVAVLILAFLVRMYASFKDMRDDPATLRPQQSDQSGIADKQPTEQNLATEPNRHPSVDHQSPASIGGSTSQNPALTPEIKAAQERWDRQHGFYYNQEHQQYLQLGDRELQNLSASGDIAATQILAARFTLVDPKRAIELLEGAAVMGSTYALLSISNLWTLQKQLDSSKLDDGSGSFDPNVSALTYALVAELRETDATASQIRALIDSDELTDEEIGKACRQAKRLYEDLKRRRTELGLSPEFDNSPRPPSAAGNQAQICSP